MIRRVLLGNEAIAWGLLKEGATVLSSYPGTPASEILDTAIRLKGELGLPVFAEWAVNEKVAFEIALANSWLGGRSAAMMKQVGLNVALDALMSAAYTGVRGGFIVVSADDPGPYSSQTEQDSRFLAMFAKIPCLDPSTPREAMEMVGEAFRLSERYGIPVMLRPVSWVCHARQGLELEEIRPHMARLNLEKDTFRWAALPRRRFVLHRELNEKVKRIASEDAHRIYGNRGAEVAVLASGFPFALLMDALKKAGKEEEVCVIKVDRPYPLPTSVPELLEGFRRVLVLEETYPVMELQLPSRKGVLGRLDGTVPSEGELRPEAVLSALGRLLEEDLAPEGVKLPEGQPPRLCAGCPHRAAFWALKEALPGGFYPSDIGCYTLGLNMGAVDAFLCMGAGVSLAEGFYLAMKTAGVPIPPIGATVGDSTFFHACVPPLIDAVNKKAAFVLVVLDNGTTAMTGGQPTPAEPPEGLRAVSLEGVIRGCGVEFVEVVDPYDFPRMVEAIRKAHEFCRRKEVPAVVISRRPCPLMVREGRRKVTLREEDCVGCMVCLESECPAIAEGDGRPVIEEGLCNGCGLCAHICPHGALVVEEGV